ncbi:hypothetical protein SSTU70S_03052 [Stutzerimonas stutzeri]
MEQQQRLARDAAADVALADGGKSVATRGIGQRHVQLAHFEKVDVGNRQLDEHSQHPRQQGRCAPHRDIHDLAQGIAKTDGFTVGARRQRRLLVQQAEARQRLIEVQRLGRLGMNASAPSSSTRRTASS